MFFGLSSSKRAPGTEFKSNKPDPLSSLSSVVRFSDFRFMAPTDTPPLALEPELEWEPKTGGFGCRFRGFGVSGIFVV